MLFVRVTTNVKLLAYSEMEILADVSDLPQRNQTYVLEDVNIQNAGVMMTCAMVMTGESVPVHVMNPTNQPVTLKGTRIIQLAEIEEMDDSSLMVFSVQRRMVSPEQAELGDFVGADSEQASLESEEQEKLFVLLLEYTDMFALCNELGRTNVLQHEIHTRCK